MRHDHCGAVFSVITVTRETTAVIRTRILCSPPAVAVGLAEWNGQDQKALNNLLISAETFTEL